MVSEEGAVIEKSVSVTLGKCCPWERRKQSCSSDETQSRYLQKRLHFHGGNLMRDLMTTVLLKMRRVTKTVPLKMILGAVDGMLRVKISMRVGCW